MTLSTTSMWPCGGVFDRRPKSVDHMAAVRLLLLGLWSLATAESKAPAVSAEDLYGYPEQGYALSLDLGTPSQAIRVVVDTGSSNLAVAATANVNISRHFMQQRSSSVHCGSRQAKVMYQSGSWQADICQDVVRLAGGGLTEFAYVALIRRSKNFFVKSAQWEGILGLGYSSLAMPDKSITPVMDAAVSSGLIANLFSISLCGRVATNNFSYGGSLVFGDMRYADNSTSLLYADLAEERFYGVLLTDVGVGNTSLGMACQEYNKPTTFVDSGTTFLAVPSSVFLRLVTYIRKMANASGSCHVCDREDFWTGLLHYHPEDEAAFLATFPAISLSLALSQDSSKYFSLTIPSHLYMQAVPCKESRTQACFVFSVQESSVGSILGTVVMEGYYVVFDRQNKRLGFANSSCSVKSLHLAKPHVSGPFTRAAGERHKECRYPEPSPPKRKLSGFQSTVVFLGVAGGILLLLMCSWDNCLNKRSLWGCMPAAGDSNATASDRDQTVVNLAEMDDLSLLDQPLSDAGVDESMVALLT